jgi:hypothetical protein
VALVPCQGAAGATEQDRVGFGCQEAIRGIDHAGIWLLTNQVLDRPASDAEAAVRQRGLDKGREDVAGERALFAVLASERMQRTAPHGFDTVMLQGSLEWFGAAVVTQVIHQERARRSHFRILMRQTGDQGTQRDLPTAEQYLVRCGNHGHISVTQPVDEFFRGYLLQPVLLRHQVLLALPPFPFSPLSLRGYPHLFPPLFAFVAAL